MRHTRPLILIVVVVTVLAVATTSAVAQASGGKMGRDRERSGAPSEDGVLSESRNQLVAGVLQNLCRSFGHSCTGTVDYGNGWTGVGNVDRGSRIGGRGQSDYFPPSAGRGPTGGSSGRPPAGGPAPCVPSWSSSTSAPKWISSGGSYFYGTKTKSNDGCGRSRTSRDVTCFLQDCVDVPTKIAWDDVVPKIAATDPQISTSPDPESLVHVATWFWHDEWRTFSDSASHPSAPVTVTVEAVPYRTNWDYGQGTVNCARAPQPFDFGLLAFDEDPDAECNSHRYTYPSLNTGPLGEDAYEISAQVHYRRVCTVTGAPTSVVPTLCANPRSLYTDAPIGRTLLPVYELQGVLRG